MSRMNAYYDGFAQLTGWSIGGAVVYLSSYVSITAIGILYLHGLVKDRRDSFHTYMGPVFLLLGFIGIFHGIQLIRAIRRHNY